MVTSFFILSGSFFVVQKIALTINRRKFSSRKSPGSPGS